MPSNDDQTTGVVHCSHEGCPANHPDHYWGHVRASEWFHARNGKAWCPEHLPGWVKPWRESKGQR